MRLAYGFAVCGKVTLICVLLILVCCGGFFVFFITNAGGYYDIRKGLDNISESTSDFKYSFQEDEKDFAQALKELHHHLNSAQKQQYAAIGILSFLFIFPIVSLVVQVVAGSDYPTGSTKCVDIIVLLLGTLLAFISSSLLFSVCLATCPDLKEDFNKVKYEFSRLLMQRLIISPPSHVLLNPLVGVGAEDQKAYLQYGSSKMFYFEGKECAEQYQKKYLIVIAAFGVITTLIFIGTISLAACITRPEPETVFPQDTQYILVENPAAILVDPNGYYYQQQQQQPPPPYSNEQQQQLQQQPYGYQLSPYHQQQLQPRTISVTLVR